MILIVRGIISRTLPPKEQAEEALTQISKSCVSFQFCLKSLFLKEIYRVSFLSRRERRHGAREGNKPCQWPAGNE